MANRFFFFFLFSKRAFYRVPAVTAGECMTVIKWVGGQGGGGKPEEIYIS